MASEMEDILKEVDRIMGEMRTNTVAEIVMGYSMRLINLQNDVTACLKQFMGLLLKMLNPLLQSANLSPMVATTWSTTDSWPCLIIGPSLLLPQPNLP